MSEQQLSQEEIQERMRMAQENCLFCKIAKKEIPAKIIFEDEMAMAILDINPATTGHLLLFPKEHYMMMPMVPDQVLGHLGVLSNYLAELVKQTFEAEDVSVFAANGAAAGQQVQHFMYHIIPQYEDQNTDFSTGDKQVPEDKLKELIEKMKQSLNKLNSK